MKGSIGREKRYRMALVIALSVGLFGFAGCLGSQGSGVRVDASRDRVAAARAATRAGDWDEAAGRWNDIYLSGGPEAGRACAETARALCRLGDVEGALRMVEHGLASFPGDAELLEMKGNVLIEHGFRRAAEAALLAALEAEPDRPSALLALGRIRTSLGLEESARKPLQRRYELGFRDGETCRLLAEVSLSSDDWVKAFRNYERAIAAGQRDLPTLVTAASLCLDANVRREFPNAETRAREWLQYATEQDPQCTQAYYYLGRLDHLQGRDEDAVHNLRRSVETDPTFVPALACLAELYAELGDRDLAQEMVDRALEFETDVLKRKKLQALVVSLEPHP